MAVDYGNVRTGVAVSDASATIAGEAWVFQEYNMKAAALVIAGEAVKRSADVVVVGYPKNMDGSSGEQAKKSEEFARLIGERCAARIELWDERLTTVGAHRVMADNGVFGKKRRKNIDAAAATLILEGYLRYINTEQGGSASEE